MKVILVSLVLSVVVLGQQPTEKVLVTDTNGVVRWATPAPACSQDNLHKALSLAVSHLRDPNEPDYTGTLSVLEQKSYGFRDGLSMNINDEYTLSDGRKGIVKDILNGKVAVVEAQRVVTETFYVEVPQEPPAEPVVSDESGTV